MWKTEKNIWREIQIPLHSRLVDEWASLSCPFQGPARLGTSLFGRYCKPAR